MPKFDREKARKDLQRRHQESHERMGGEQSYKYFKTDVDIPFFKATITKNKPHIIDIIPYLAGKNPPQVSQKNVIRPNDPMYVSEVFVHQNIGPSGDKWFLCLAKNFGLPCPVCEDIAEMEREGKEYDDYADIAPKSRCAYNVVCYDDATEEKKGIQIWEVSRKYSEDILQKISRSGRTGGVVFYADTDVGQSIEFDVADDKYRTISGHRLVPRDYKISDEIIDKAFCLDEILHVPTYEEIAECHFGKKKADAPAPEKEDDVPMSPTRTESPKAPEPEKEKESENKCPDGGTFGVDIDKRNACGGGTCKKYLLCEEEMVKLEEKRLRDRMAAREARNQEK